MRPNLPSGVTSRSIRPIVWWPRLEIALERALGLQEAVVAPLSGPDADPTAPIAAATGQYISGMVHDGMKIGIGWGRTLLQAIEFIDERPAANVSVVSLLGGITKAKQLNPAECAWQFARLFQAECFLLPAPGLVDSVETKRALIERCGIGDVFAIARSLDAVIISVGEMAPTGTAYRFGYFSEADRLSLIAAGAVGDMLYNFFDITGALVDHPINSRVMAVPMESIKAAPRRILTSGGKRKVEAIHGALRLLKPTVFITDEVTAAAILKQEPGKI